MDSLQAEVNQCTEKIEDEILAPIQGYGYKNASLCFMPGANRRSRQACVERALNPANQASEYVQNEFNNLSERVNRCAQTCYDDTVGFSSTQSEEQKTRLEECTKACMFKAKAALPDLMKRIRETVRPLLPPSSQFTEGTLLSENSTTAAPAGMPGFNVPGTGFGGMSPPGVGGIPLPGGGLPGGGLPGNLPKLG
ncbi:hypothetical protein ACHWQZ_G004669 [Mnemiopsis leidyi]